MKKLQRFVHHRQTAGVKNISSTGENSINIKVSMTEKAHLDTEAFNSALNKLSTLKIKGNIHLCKNSSISLARIIRNNSK